MADLEPSVIVVAPAVLFVAEFSIDQIFFTQQQWYLCLGPALLSLLSVGSNYFYSTNYDTPLVSYLDFSQPGSLPYMYGGAFITANVAMYLVLTAASSAKSS